jgi:hypothetical protein
LSEKPLDCPEVLRSASSARSNLSICLGFVEDRLLAQYSRHSRAASTLVRGQPRWLTHRLAYGLDVPQLFAIALIVTIHSLRYRHANPVNRNRAPVTLFFNFAPRTVVTPYREGPKSGKSLKDSFYDHQKNHPARSASRFLLLHPITWNSLENVSCVSACRATNSYFLQCGWKCSIHLPCWI